MAFEFKLTVPDLVGEGEDVSTIVESPPASGDSKTGLITGFWNKGKCQTGLAILEILGWSHRVQKS